MLGDDHALGASMWVHELYVLTALGKHGVRDALHLDRTHTDQFTAAVAHPVDVECVHVAFNERVRHYVRELSRCRSSAWSVGT